MTFDSYMRKGALSYDVRGDGRRVIAKRCWKRKVGAVWGKGRKIGRVVDCPSANRMTDGARARRKQRTDADARLRNGHERVNGRRNPSVPTILFDRDVCKLHPHAHQHDVWSVVWSFPWGVIITTARALYHAFMYRDGLKGVAVLISIS